LLEFSNYTNIFLPLVSFDVLNFMLPSIHNSYVYLSITSVSIIQSIAVRVHGRYLCCTSWCKQKYRCFRKPQWLICLCNEDPLCLLWTRNLVCTIFFLWRNNSICLGRSLLRFRYYTQTNSTRWDSTGPEWTKRYDEANGRFSQVCKRA